MMPDIEIHPIYKSAFGYREGDVFRIVGHVERWDGWEGRLQRIIVAWNELNLPTMAGTLAAEPRAVVAGRAALNPT